MHPAATSARSLVDTFGRRGLDSRPAKRAARQTGPSQWHRGAVAQLGERLNGIQEVDGSIPFGSTNGVSCLRGALRRLILVLAIR